MASETPRQRDSRIAREHRYSLHIERLVAAAPPLTDEQRARLVILLRPVR
jgi:hypothetical protein